MAWSADVSFFSSHLVKNTIESSIPKNSTINMQIRVLLTVLVGVTFTAALTPADCDCVSKRISAYPVYILLVV